MSNQGKRGGPLRWLRAWVGGLGAWGLVPLLVLAFWWGYLARLVRASMLEVLGASYIRTAWAFGLHDRVVFYKYALKNAIMTPANLWPKTTAKELAPLLAKYS